MRRLKNKRARMKVEAGMEARADQAEVWHEVAERGRELDASSPTAAMHDIYEGHRERLAEIRAGIELREGQCGSVAVIDGRIAMLDFVGRADVYAALQPAIVEGYALDALAQERSGERTKKHRSRSEPSAASCCSPATRRPPPALLVRASARPRASRPTGSRARP